jgi:hypothetical protein
VALDDGDPFAEIGRLDRSLLPGWAGADDDQVQVSHWLSVTCGPD